MALDFDCYRSTVCVLLQLLSVAKMVGRSLLSGAVSRILQNPGMPRLKEKRLLWLMH
ncbi:hypothetical protein DPMN_042600 [Dreissena polymorpha]|uniref:Uncharacterized protein n=1 Tax=Dreissena polymorpha TaxID=45954 RepID=A0A9D4D131_DREPO|nr:hypothetical protein DPMN_042600 [Dreissena polymorpha]